MSAIARSSRRVTESTSNSRERWNVAKPRIEEKKTPSSSSEAPEAASAAANDPAHPLPEARQAGVEARVGGIGDHLGAAGREDLGVRKPGGGVGSGGD